MMVPCINWGGTKYLLDVPCSTAECICNPNIGMPVRPVSAGWESN